jgi:hypothetical protein
VSADPDGPPGHGGNAGLCFEKHFCPPCEAGNLDECVDMFLHPICGLVACSTFDVPTECGRCGKDPADGFAMIGDVRYCHGDDEEWTCYMSGTVEGLTDQPPA